MLAKHALASLPVLPAPRYARKHFPSTRYLDYAITVENYTLQKVCVRGGGAWWVGGWGAGQGGASCSAAHCTASVLPVGLLSRRTGVGAV